jgi:kinesin family protein 20
LSDIKESILQVMIVNVNPYDTGYDENSHVMKFAALAKEVYTTPMAAPLHRAPSPTKLPTAVLGHNRGPLRDPEIVPLPYVKRKVTIEVKGQAGKKESETCLEVMEEDEDVIMGEPEDGTEGESDGEGISSLVDALFAEIEELRAKVCCSHSNPFLWLTFNPVKFVESEMRCAIIEAETREEVMREMEERMRSMEKLYERRFMNEVLCILNRRSTDDEDSTGRRERAQDRRQD